MSVNQQENISSLSESGDGRHHYLTNKKTYINYGNIAARMLIPLLASIFLIIPCMYVDMTKLFHIREFTCKAEHISDMKTSKNGLFYYTANVSMVGYSIQVEWDPFCKSKTMKKAETCKQYYGGKFPCLANGLKLKRKEGKIVSNEAISLMINPEYYGDNILLCFFIGLGGILVVSIGVVTLLLILKIFKGRKQDYTLFCGYFEKSIQGEVVFSDWNGDKDAKSIFGNVNQRNIASSQLISDEELQYHEFYHEEGVPRVMKIIYPLVGLIPFLIFFVISFFTQTSIFSVGTVWICLVALIAGLTFANYQFNMNIMLTNMKIMIMRSNGWKVELSSIELSSISKAWAATTENQDETHFLSRENCKLFIELKEETGNSHSKVVLLEKTAHAQVYIDAVNKYHSITNGNQTNPPHPPTSSQEISSNPSSMYPSVTDYEMQTYQN